MFWKCSSFLIHHILDALTCLLKCLAPFLLSFWSYLVMMIINATVKVLKPCHNLGLVCLFVFPLTSQ